MFAISVIIAGINISNEVFIIIFTALIDFIIMLLIKYTQYILLEERATYFYSFYALSMYGDSFFHDQTHKVSCQQ